MNTIPDTTDILQDRLAALMEMAALVNSSHDRAVVVHHAINSICRLTGAETGSLLLVDDNDDLRFEIVLGQQEDSLKGLVIPKGTGLAGHVVQTNLPMIVPDVQADPRFFRGADVRTSFVTRSMILVPLRVKDDVIGVIQTINKIEGCFDHADLKLAMAFANQIAPAVQASN